MAAFFSLERSEPDPVLDPFFAETPRGAHGPERPAASYLYLGMKVSRNALMDVTARAS